MNVMTEQELIDFIDTAKVKSELLLPYALAILSQVQFARINEAIILKWSRSALNDIKTGAWGIIEFLNKSFEMEIANRLEKYYMEYKNYESN